ncbi:MAG: hypothetical protein SFY80_12950 [Verrucomicrobiota bacterium]|nr:hypothetical protein [Verrucomicrobiota bacterium]
MALCSIALSIPLYGESALLDRAEKLGQEAANSMTARQLYQQLDGVYCPTGNWKPYFTVEGDSFCFTLPGKEGERSFSIVLASETEQPAPPAYRNWRTRAENTQRTVEKPLAGVRIGIDPGHIGGEWAKMEERCFQIGEEPPVKEGDLTLKVAQMLKPLLEARGAVVFLVRENAEPVTSKRPEDFWEEARTRLLRTLPEAADEAPEPEARETAKLSERLFYRSAEIIARSDRFREWKPDIVLCLHFDGKDWADPTNPTLVASNHFHTLVNGAYTSSELAIPAMRMELLERLFAGTSSEEIALAETVSTVFARDTGLPPLGYTTPNAVKVGPSSYVWARNLLANRVYPCPVLFLEPYVANSTAVYPRIQEGDYDGLRVVSDIGEVRSIFREYADAVVAGLVEYYTMGSR